MSLLLRPSVSVTSRHGRALSRADGARLGDARSRDAAISTATALVSAVDARPHGRALARDQTAAVVQSDTGVATHLAHSAVACTNFPA